MSKVLVEREDIESLVGWLRSDVPVSGEMSARFTEALNQKEQIPYIMIPALEGYIDANGEEYYGVTARLSQLSEYFSHELGLEYDNHYTTIYGENWRLEGLQIEVGGEPVLQIRIAEPAKVETLPLTCQFCGQEESVALLQGGAGIGEECSTGLGTTLTQYGVL